MCGDGGFVLPLFVEEQPRRVFAIRMDMMGDTAGLCAGTGAMLATQRNDLVTPVGRDGEGC